VPPPRRRSQLGGQRDGRRPSRLFTVVGPVRSHASLAIVDGPGRRLDPLEVASWRAVAQLVGLRNQKTGAQLQQCLRQPIASIGESRRSSIGELIKSKGSSVDRIFRPVLHDCCRFSTADCRDRNRRVPRCGSKAMIDPLNRCSRPIRSAGRWR